MFDLAPAATTAAALVGGVTDDDLDRPTPCPEMTVGTLLGHLHLLALAFSDAAAKVDGPFTAQAPDPAASPLPDDWRTAVPVALGDLVRAWSEPDAWAGMTRAGGLQMAGEEAAAVALDELVLHGWDLAAATGQDYRVDEANLDVVEGFCSAVPDDPAMREGLFGPRVEVGDDASRWERVLGLSGRDPGWTAADDQPR